MKTTNIDKELSIMMSDIEMRCDYHHHLDANSKKVIIVEGQTDELFLNRIKKQDVISFNVGSLKARAIMLNQTSAKALNYTNAKDMIISLFIRLSSNPEFYGFPIRSGSWPIYGLIDRDYNDIPTYHIPRLFITDTHDIETLILYTDKDVLSRIDGISISDDVLRNALYLAEQFSYYRNALYKLGEDKQEIDLKSINSSDGRIDFASFVENNHIVLRKLLKLMYSNQGINLSNEKAKALTDELNRDRQLKKHLTLSGEWKHSMDSFSPTQMNDFWLNVRGHDILSAICFYDSSAENLFRSMSTNKLNRKFETAIINKYDISKFALTNLYQDMNAAMLVESID